MTARLNTDIWVKAHLRRCFAAGLTGAVVRKGAPKAGVAFVKIVMADNLVRLLGPSPGAAYDADGARNWHSIFGVDPVHAEVANDYLSKQMSYDPDIWIIDIDDRSGEALLEFFTD